MTYDFEKLTKIGTLFLVVEGVEEQEEYPNDLSALLDDQGLIDLYESVRAVCGGSALRHVVQLGERGLAQAGVPKIKAKKICKKAAAGAGGGGQACGGSRFWALAGGGATTSST